MNLMSPQLQAFIAVVENKTVHAAATSLNLTQTAVTQRIRNLEAQLKTTLFIRSRRGMEITKEGEALLRYCHSIKALEGETLAQIAGLGINSEIEISIAGPSSIMRSRIAPKLIKFTKIYSNVLLHFVFDDNEDLHHKLRSGEYDFAIMTADNITQEMTEKKMQPEHYILVCSSAWENRSLTDILKNERIIDFYPFDKMTFNYLEHFNLLELANKSRHFVNNIDSMADLVINQMGYTTLTADIAEKYLQAKQLIILNQAKIFKYQPHLVWYSRTEIPNYFADLIKQIE